MASQNPQYVLIMPVWGDHHTGLFLRYCIPFLLTDGNVGAFPNRSLTVHVTSRRSDFVRMRDNSNYRQLAAAVTLLETEIDDVIDLSMPHRAMTECYLLALKALSSPDNAVTIFPTPDCILSRNALKQIIALIEAEWGAVMVCGLRATLETAGPLLDRVIADEDGPNRISERELCGIVLDNLHPITLTCDVRSSAFMASWPSHVYWVAPDRAWLAAHCFHLHPIAVRGVPKSIDINTTIDGDYLMGLGIAPNRIYIEDNSDTFFCVELSPGAKTLSYVVGSATPQAVVRFSISYCNRFHREFFVRPIYWWTARADIIPDEIRYQASEYVGAVRRGSMKEKLRHEYNLAVTRVPALRFLVRIIFGVMRRLRRLLPFKGGTT